VQDFFRPAGSENYHMRLFFSCTTDDSMLTIQTSEIATAQWFSREEIRNMLDADLYPDHRQVIRDAVQS
jgi:NADH pyrophosphatase NudC (nudix superfamily)